jgi:membrane-associated phospholipid phosphatase
VDLKALARESYPHERLFTLYFLFLALLISVAGAQLGDRWPRVAWHLAGACTTLFLLPALGSTQWRNVLRHWLPVVLLALVYVELDTLNDMFTASFHDEAIIALEQRVFGTQLAVSFREWIPFRPLSEYLHLSYFSYYFLFPMLGVSLSLRGRWAEFRHASTVVLAAFVVCYTIFIFYPVAGPWNHLPRPTHDEVGHIVPPIVHALLIKGESIGTAFPSSHVAAALAIWLAAWRVDRRVFVVQAFLVPGLILGTMYGGFHYGVDVLAGVIVGAAVSQIGWTIINQRSAA